MRLLLWARCRLWWRLRRTWDPFPSRSVRYTAYAVGLLRLSDPRLCFKIPSCSVPCKIPSLFQDTFSFCSMQDPFLVSRCLLVLFHARSLPCIQVSTRTCNLSSANRQFCLKVPSLFQPIFFSVFDLFLFCFTTLESTVFRDILNQWISFRISPGKPQLPKYSCPFSRRPERVREEWRSNGESQY